MMVPTMQAKAALLTIFFTLLISTAHSSTVKNMQLHGEGKAYYMKFIKVYDAALYTTHAANEEEIIQGGVSKCLLLQYDVSLKQKDFIKAANTVLERQFTAEQLEVVRDEIDRLYAGYVDVKDGDEFSIRLVIKLRSGETSNFLRWGKIVT
jgi:hypothetical protein